MKITTKRLILRPGTKKDIDDIVEGINNLNVSRWLLVVPYPYKRKDALFWLNKNFKPKRKKKKNNIDFCIELKEEKKVIGAIGLPKIDEYQKVATVGYWISEKYWKKGYGTEALDAILKMAFEKLKLRRIEAGILEGNPTSGTLLEKFGGIHEGIKRKALKSTGDGKIYDEHIYGILKEDYQKAVKKRIEKENKKNKKK
jgi:[ribosomal protein S5]-alanine N-acetyltransferase